MKLSINDNKFKVKVQTSPKETQEGMMNKTFDKTFNGMLFVMDEDTSCFWMKNCIIPLDIIFIEGTTITKVHHNCQPCKDEDCDSYCGRGRLVLEIQGSSANELDIKKGDQVKLLL